MKSEKVFKYLIEKKIIQLDHILDEEGNTFAHLLFKDKDTMPSPYEIENLVSCSKSEIEKLLELRNYNNMTPLEIASEHHQTLCMFYTAKYVDSQNAQYQMRNVLRRLITSENIDLIQEILEENPSLVNEAEHDNAPTHLAYAVATASPEFVESMLKFNWSKERFKKDLPNIIKAMVQYTILTKKCDWTIDSLNSYIVERKKILNLLYDRRYITRSEDVKFYDYSVEVIKATAENRIENLNQLLEKYPDLLETLHSQDNDTLLHIAAENNSLDSIQYLISKKPDLCIKTNRQGQTPLFFAKSGAAFKALLEAAEYNSYLDTKERTPLFTIMCNTTMSIEEKQQIIRLCSENGVNLKQIDIKGNNFILHYIIKTTSLLDLNSNYKERLRLLCEVLATVGIDAMDEFFNKKGSAGFSINDIFKDDFQSMIDHILHHTAIIGTFSEEYRINGSQDETLLLQKVSKDLPMGLSLQEGARFLQAIRLSQNQESSSSDTEELGYDSDEASSDVESLDFENQANHDDASAIIHEIDALINDLAARQEEKYKERSEKPE